jgi:hypothetical protein
MPPAVEPYSPYAGNVDDGLFSSLFFVLGLDPSLHCGDELLRPSLGVTYTFGIGLELDDPSPLGKVLDCCLR